MRGSAVVVLAAALAVAACSEGQGPGERGRHVYLSQCTSCHAIDPAQPGPVGPEVKGASRELLEAKVLRGTYPPAYRAKRPTAVMPPQPQLAGDIPALAEYLR